MLHLHIYDHDQMFSVSHRKISNGEIAVDPNSQSFLHSNSQHEHINEAPLLLVQHTQPSKQYDWTHRLAAQADTCAVW